MPAFDPMYETADRLPPKELADLAQRALSSPAVAMLGSLPVCVVILASTRQIVYANARFLDFSKQSVDNIVGCRLGEALGCVHPPKSPRGCGTTDFCSYCGAGISILKSLKGIHETMECSIERDAGKQLTALNLQAWTASVQVDGDSLVLCTLIDISHEKRLKAIERMFFHDILNVSGGMHGLCQGMSQGIIPATEEELLLLTYASERINDIILSQQEFSDAENGEYTISPSPLQSRQTLADLLRYFAQQNPAWKGNLSLDSELEDLTVTTDKRLFLRALINMIKNALEASEPGSPVMLGCNRQGGMARFWVRNQGVLPQHVRMQLFKKSFSTKGTGRGLGTYSLKLFTENYLGGRVEFISNEVEQTVFSMTLPLWG